MSITFEQLLTDPKYREMSQMQIRDLIMSDGFPTADMFKIDKIVNPDGKYNSVSKPLYLHLQKLKAESEKKAELKLGRKSLPDEIDMSKYIKQAPIQITDQKAREIAKKPPLGITPKTIHQEMVKKERFGDLQRAITRYLENGLPINIEWIKEYNELI